MDKLDSDIAKYERNLGIDISNAKTKQKLDMELRVDGMDELFHCVDGILTDGMLGDEEMEGEEEEEYLSESEDENEQIEEGEESEEGDEEGEEEEEEEKVEAKVTKKKSDDNDDKILLKKRTPEKKFVEAPKKKLGLLKPFFDAVKQDNIKINTRGAMKEIEKHGFSEEEIAFAIFNFSINLKELDRMRTSLAVLIIHEHPKARGILSFLLGLILSQIKSQKIGSRMALIKGSLLFIHFLYVSDTILSGPFLALVQEISSRIEAQEISKFSEFFTHLVLKFIRKNDAGDFEKTGRILEDIFAKFEDQIGGSIVEKYEKHKENLTLNLDIAPFPLETNAFLTNHLKKKCLKSEIFQLDFSFEELKPKFYSLSKGALAPKEIPIALKTIGDNTATMIKEENKKIRNLGKKLGLKNEISLKTLSILINSFDHTDAVMKINNLKIKRVEKKHACNAILHSAINEAKYKDFYSKIINILVITFEDYKQGMHFALWDVFPLIKKFEKGKLLKFARFISDLLIGGGIDHRVFKFLDVEQISKQTLQISIVIIKNWMMKAQKEELVRACKLLAQKNENMEICENLKKIAILVEGSKDKYMGKMETDKQRKHFQENLELFKKKVKFQPTF